MTTAYVVVCFSGDGENFLSIYGTYDEEQTACNVCEENNEYESTNHPNDDIVYRVQAIPKNNSSILSRFAKN